MRFLCILGLVFINARAGGHEIRAIAFADGIARGGYGFWGHIDAVCAHIGDISGLIKALGRAHGLPCAHAKFAAGLLLQG